MKTRLAVSSHWAMLFSWLAIFALVLAACGGGAAPATPEPAPAEPSAPQSEAPTAEPQPPADAPTAEPQPAPNAAPTAEPQPAANSDTPGVVADLGFRPEVNGFQFENYGKSDAKNLTPAELQRIYGNGVCASTANDQCVLTPPAEQWMMQQNQSMEGGHCYGFSVAALSMFAGIISPANYGGGSTAIDLSLINNEPLQREIAYSFVFQGFDPVRNGVIAGTPNQVLDKLIEILKAGTNTTEVYTIGFFRADGQGGHAVTPFAVENRGNGIYAVLIYDNNYPKETRSILFDRNADTWNYTTTTNPAEPTSDYQGTAASQSLFLFPTTPGLSQQACTFCAGGSSGSRGSMLAAAATEYNELYLDGDPSIHAHLLLTDESGKQYGFLPDGKFVTDLPGVKSERTFSGLDDDTPEPTYFVPTGKAFQVTIDGTPLKEPDLTDVVMIGPGYDLGVFDIGLDPGQQDTLTFTADGNGLSYQTESSESPSIVFGVQLDGADFEFEIKGVDVAGGGTINASIDTKEGWLLIDTDGTEAAGQYALILSRYDDEGEEIYEHDEIILEPTDLMYIYYAKWTGNGGTLEVGIDRGSDGTVDETLELTDEN